MTAHLSRDELALVRLDFYGSNRPIPATYARAASDMADQLAFIVRSCDLREQAETWRNDEVLDKLTLYSYILSVSLESEPESPEYWTIEVVRAVWAASFAHEASSAAELLSWLVRFLRRFSAPMVRPEYEQLVREVAKRLRDGLTNYSLESVVGSQFQGFIEG